MIARDFGAGGFAVGDGVAAAGGDVVDLGEVLLTLGGRRARRR